MRRSESFHHVSHVVRKDQCSSRGGSDSGLVYVTGYDLEPQITRIALDVPKSPNLLTKSLDRIDEGLDSIVDIVITEEKEYWNNFGQHLSKNNSLKSRTKPERKEVLRTRSNRYNLKNSSESKERQKQKLELKNDEVYNGYSGKQLRSDELYEEQKQWHHQEEVNGSRKSHPFESPDDKLPMSQSRTGSRHDSFSYEKTGSKISTKPNESSIFAGRPYDAFGLGKNRFNAGKYSGNHLPKESVGGVRNSSSSVITKRGKVTDILSGLY